MLGLNCIPCQVRTLPKVLKYLPADKAKDARNFINSLQYWLGGNAENLENLILTIGQVRRIWMLLQRLCMLLSTCGGCGAAGAVHAGAAMHV